MKQKNKIKNKKKFKSLSRHIYEVNKQKNK